jgi:hypothetical protein
MAEYEYDDQEFLIVKSFSKPAISEQYLLDV